MNLYGLVSFDFVFFRAYVFFQSRIPSSILKLFFKEEYLMQLIIIYNS